MTMTSHSKDNDMITIPLSKQGKHAGKYEAIVDDIDADLAELRWCVQIMPHARTYYARGQIELNIKKQYLMHRVILSRILGRPLGKKEQVDHINGDGRDNRRNNLRVATHAQNKRNTNRYKNNTSGFKGVDTRENRYRARIRVNRKLLYLGWFDTPEEAHEAYCAAAKQHFGEFANEG